jgi:hypothetical protein
MNLGQDNLEKKQKGSLTAEERETIISWSDCDKTHFFIYSTQQPMIKKLIRNPTFVCTKKRFNANYKVYPQPISIEGYLPKRCLTIRTKLRQLNEQQKKQLAKRLKKARERKTGDV